LLDLGLLDVKPHREIVGYLLLWGFLLLLRAVFELLLTVRVHHRATVGQFVTFYEEGNGGPSVELGVVHIRIIGLVFLQHKTSGATRRLVGV